MLARCLLTVVVLSLALLVVHEPQRASGHPGRTDSSGCHTCRTNCPSWGLAYGQYHCHRGTSGGTSSGGTTGQARDPQPPVTAPVPASTNNSSSVTPYYTTIRVGGGAAGQPRRTYCTVSATTAGPRLTPGLGVRVVGVGTGPCEGWSIIDVGGGTTWVRSGYLDRSPTRAATGSPTVTPGATPTVTSDSSPITPYFTSIRDGGGTAGQPRRTDCKISTTTTGARLTPGLSVRVVRVGTGQCDGWSIVEADGGTTWVRSGYLDRAPAGAAPRSPTATPGASPPTTTGTWTPFALTFTVSNAAATNWRTAGGDPLVPAWTTCSTTGTHGGFGYPDGTVLVSIGRGGGTCEGWYLFTTDSVVFWMPATHLTISTGRTPVAPAADGEPVTVVVALWSNEVVVQRTDGSMWLLSHGSGCISLWSYSGRQVTVTSAAGSFGGVGSEISIPQRDQSCRVLSSSDDLEWVTSSPGVDFGDLHLFRSNGEIWAAETLVGCLSLTYSTKRVLVYSPSLFAGIGARIIVPDSSDDCRIWAASRL